MNTQTSTDNPKNSAGLTELPNGSQPENNEEATTLGSKGCRLKKMFYLGTCPNSTVGHLGPLYDKLKFYFLKFGSFHNSHDYF